VSAIGHYLESEGIATTGISLVREHSEVMRPPRALWVPFMLGRPLGVPGDAAFQREVLRAALELLEDVRVPVLRDFGRDAPRSEAADDDGEGLACPVNFSRPSPAGEGAHALSAALSEEIAQLQPWHELAARRRGGSTVGVSGMNAAQAGAFVAAMLDDGAPQAGPSGEPLPVALKLACDDLRAFYEEAAAGQPGELSPAALGDWYYRQTVAGDVLAAAQRAALASPDPALRFVAERVMIPRAYQRPQRG